MISAFNEITTCTGDMIDRLMEIQLLDIFYPLFALEIPDGDASKVLKYNKPTATKIVKYIAHCYSIESDKVIKGGDWMRIKGDTFRAMDIPDKFYDDVVKCKCFDVVKVIKGWLEYQNQENFETYCMLSDLIIEFRLAANGVILKSGGEIDYEQKRKCAEGVLELQVLRNDVEQKLIQNNANLKGLPEVKLLVKKRTTTGPESYSPNLTAS
jgi:hypothetical protein